MVCNDELREILMISTKKYVVRMYKKGVMLVCLFLKKNLAVFFKYIIARQRVQDYNIHR